MTTEKFLELLEEFYDEVPDTGFCVKFFAQATTFSFEIHDTSERGYTTDSCVSQSGVYYWWIGPDKADYRREIIDDILSAVNRANISKELKIIIEE